VSFTDSQLRAGTYIPGGPKPPFTPGYELVGVVEELGPGCSRLHVGDRIGALTVWGADAESVCMPEAGAVEVPENLDPAPARPRGHLLMRPSMQGSSTPFATLSRSRASNVHTR